MLRISNKEIIDVVKYSDDKVIIVEKVIKRLSQKMLI